MTIFRTSPSFLHRRSQWSGGGFGMWISSCLVALKVLSPAAIDAQTTDSSRRAESPVAPASSVGAVSGEPRLSLLGLTGLPSSDETAMPSREVLFLGLSSGIGRTHGVRFTAIATGYFLGGTVGTRSSAEGALAVRAWGRVNGVRSWATLSYGRANALGGPAGGSISPAGGIGFEPGHADTTVSRRVDVGGIARAEAGIVGTHHGFDMSLGLSVERATRVTTQTINIEIDNDVPVLVPLAPASRTSITRTLRGVQRREIANGMASLGFYTGRTSWLATVTAPVASWITSDALSPRPRGAPPVASLAVVQPITGWLSAVGSASTYASNAANSALRDDIAFSRNSNFAPVFALGVSIAHIPFINRRGEVPLGGILAFETHIDTGIDSVTVITENGVAQNSFKVGVVIDAPTAGSVELMGDATAWTIASMSKGKDNRWHAILNVTTGSHRLSVRSDGGEWIAPPGLPLGNSDFGNAVGLLVVEQPRVRR